MAEPFLRFAIDHRTQQVLQTESDPSRTLVSRRDDEWIVVHDSRGRIVVRGYAARGGMNVIGTGQWQDGTIVNRTGAGATGPSPEQWATLERLMYGPIRRQQPGPYETDDGEVPRTGAAPAAPEAPTTAAGKIKSVVFTILVLVAFVAVGVAAWWWKSLDKGNVANGDACSVNSDCRSNRCEKSTATQKKTCAAAGVRGDACQRDRECASNTCTRYSCE